MLKHLKLFFISFVLLQLLGCPAAIIGGGAIGIDTMADRRTPGVILEDSNIQLKAFTGIQKLKGDIHTNVTSYNGHVLVLGQVPSEEIKSTITDQIKALANVKSVMNDLTIGPVNSLSERVEDTLITSNVKARFFKENKVSPFYVKVVTENKVVYLLGILNEKEAKEAEEIAQNTNRVIKVVKVFEYIKN